MAASLAAVAGGCVLGVAVVAVLAIAFAYGVGPAEYLIEHDTLHPF